MPHTENRFQPRVRTLLAMITRKMSRNQLFLIGGALLIIVIVLVTVVTVAGMTPMSDSRAASTDATDPSDAKVDAVPTANGSSRRIMGYYLETATGGNCPGIPPMSPDKIPVQYYTHLIYGFSPLINTTSWELSRPSSSEVQRYQKFNALKGTRPQLRTMLSLGGDLPDLSPITRTTSDSTKLNHYVQTTIAFVRKYSFDGIDIDWEFPTDISRGGSLNDTEGFIAFVMELRRQIDAENRDDGREKLLLSAIVPGGSYWGQYYSIRQTIGALDFVNILAYNILGTWRGLTDCSAPLENPHDTNAESAANALRYFLGEAKKAGVGPDRFNYGISFWAIAYRLRQALNSTATISPSTGTLAYTSADQPATPGFCTKQPGYLAYFEVTRLINTSKATRVDEDPVSACKYFTYNQDQWVGYDDASTFGKKIDYAESQGVTGVSVWGMDADNPETFELTQSLYNKVSKS